MNDVQFMNARSAYPAVPDAVSRMFAMEPIKTAQPMKLVQRLLPGDTIVEGDRKTYVKYVGDGCDQWHTHVYTDKGTQCWDKGYPVKVIPA